MLPNLSHSLPFGYNTDTRLFITFGVLTFLAALCSINLYIFVALAAGPDHSLKPIDGRLIGGLLAVGLLFVLLVTAHFGVRFIIRR